MPRKNTNDYEPEIVSHPGESLLDILHDRGLSQSELAVRMGRPVKTINEIIKGKNSIIPDTAIQLERVLGIPASFWIKRQYHFDEYLSRREEACRLSSQLDWLQSFPIKEMIKHQFIPKCKDKTEQLKALLTFFEIASPDVFMRQYQNSSVLYRTSLQYEADIYAIQAWLQQGRIIAKRLSCLPFDSVAFKSALKKIRSLTLQPPDVFVTALTQICSQSGVAVVFVPELPKIRAYGASHWLGNRPIIQLSLRGKKDDVLWFTFYHEAGHIILHHGKNRKKTVYLDNDIKKGPEDAEANTFASEMLLPKKYLDAFVNTHQLNKENIIRFARSKSIAPSIVVGQLHHFQYAPYNHFQDMRKTLIWDSGEP